MCPTSSTHGLRAITGCHPSPTIPVKTPRLNVSGGETRTGSTMVVDMAPANTDTTVDVPGSLCDDVEALSDTETTTAVKVYRENTMVV